LSTAKYEQEAIWKYITKNWIIAGNYPMALYCAIFFEEQIMTRKIEETKKWKYNQKK